MHLGVSQNEKRPNALFLAWLEKEKTIFASRFCSLNCVAWLYINFSKLAFWFALYAFQIAKNPRGRTYECLEFCNSDTPRAFQNAHLWVSQNSCAYLPSLAVNLRPLGLLIFPVWKVFNTNQATQFKKQGDWQNPRRVHWVSQKLLDAHGNSTARVPMMASWKIPEGVQWVLLKLLTAHGSRSARLPWKQTNKKAGFFPA